MRTRLLGLAFGICLAGQAASQPVEAPALREAMAATATQLLETVAGGAGPIEQMAGFNRAERMVFAADDPQRTNWQYWPAARVGLSLGLMTNEQRRLTHELLTSVLSSNGYLKAVQIMQLDEILAFTDEAGFPRSMDHYALAIFGEPSLDRDWAWRFEGHHVSLNVAVGTNQLTVTPSFFGSNPAEVQTGPLTGLRVHGIVEDMARELVDSLDARQRRSAIISDRAPGEILTTQLRAPRERWDAWIEAVQPEGVAVAGLNEVQQHWVRAIVAEAVANYRGEIADPITAEIDVADLSFAWMGSTARGQPHYFRLQGDDFVFEYDNVQNDGNHVHSVWRSKSSDFGGDTLLSHYRAAAH